MEVHHHPDLHHRRKKFREYLLEFLMIFLAVSLGFLAESFREYLGDRSREKEYMISLVKEIREDTADLHEIIVKSDQRLKGVDSLIALSKQDMKTVQNQRLFTRYWLYYLNTSSEFKSYDATIQQLKNTGNLRLIRKDRVADSIVAYDNLTQAAYAQAAYNFGVYKDFQNLLEEIIDFTMLTDGSYFDLKKGIFTGKELPPLNTDPAKMRLFFNQLVTYRLASQFYNDHNLTTQLDAANRLIGYLERVYKLPRKE